MKSSLLLFPVLSIGTTLLLVRSAQAFDPYESRLDREYKSFSQSLSRAYQVPSSGNNSTSNNSASSYSSSSMASNSSSSGSGSVLPTVPFQMPSLSQKEIERNRAAWKKKWDDYALERAVEDASDEADEKAMWGRIHDANARYARDKFLNAPKYSQGIWEGIRRESGGQAPLQCPLNNTFENKSSEFNFCVRGATTGGKDAQWENMRLGQMCLGFECAEADPTKAFTYYSRSNPAWLEVQFGLGVCYLRGLGVEPNPKKALELLEKVAADKVPPGGRTTYIGGGEVFQDRAYEACRELAIAYDLGRGLPADVVLSKQWFDRALYRPLFSSDSSELKALRQQFWKRNISKALQIVQADYQALRNGSKISFTMNLLEDLVQVGDAKVIFEVGDFVDIRDYFGEEQKFGSQGRSYFLAAAKLDYEPAVRAYFSPAKNGYYKESFADQAELEYVSENWPTWEAKWKADSMKGDAAANVPLAFYYSGARGIGADLEQARIYAAKMPADLPAAQRKAIEGAIAKDQWKEEHRFLDSIYAKFRADYSTLDFTHLPGPADPVLGAKLREEGNELASSNLLLAREKWLDGAVLGDLAAQVQLHIYLRNERTQVSDSYEKSLQECLEAAALKGDQGAIATLAVLMDGSATNSVALFHADGETDDKWHQLALQNAAKKVAFEKTAANLARPEAQYEGVHTAARTETEGWNAQIKKWGLTNTSFGQLLAEELVLSPEAFRALEGKHQTFVMLKAKAKQLDAQLPILEKNVTPKRHNAESNARFLQGCDAWLWLEGAERDVPRALNYFSESAGLGHPLAPLAIAHFYGSGGEGFPKNVVLAKRWQHLADARLTALAQSGDAWAQSILGDLLVTNDSERTFDAERAGAFEWLPLDKARGMKWLQTAALNGAALPRNFDDAAGMPVAWYIYNTYSEWNQPVQMKKWRRVESLVYKLWSTDKPPTPAARAAFKVKAQNILSSPS